MMLSSALVGLVAVLVLFIWGFFLFLKVFLEPGVLLFVLPAPDLFDLFGRKQRGYALRKMDVIDHP